MKQSYIRRKRERHEVSKKKPKVKYMFYKPRVQETATLLCSNPPVRGTKYHADLD